VDIDAIIRKNFGSTSPAEQSKFRKWTSRLEELAGSDSLEDALRKKAFVCKAFYLLNAGTGASLRLYHYIRQYLAFVYEHFGLPAQSFLPSREEVLASQKKTIYFKDLNDVLQFVDNIGNARLSPYDPNQDLLPVKSIIILGWNGFLVQDMIAVKRKDIQKTEDDYYIEHESLGRKTISEQEYRILKSFALADEYRTFPSGKIKSLKGNDNLLFRSTREAAEIDKNDILGYLTRFNSAIPNSSHSINLIYLRKNALFVKVLNDTSDNLTEKIQRYFMCTQPISYAIKKEYLQWKETYYPKD